MNTELSLEEIRQRQIDHRPVYKVDDLVEHFMTLEEDGQIQIPYIQIAEIESELGPVGTILDLNLHHFVSNRETLEEDVIQLLNDPKVSDFPTFKKAQIEGEKK
jgi:hypothetical protein